MIPFLTPDQLCNELSIDPNASSKTQNLVGQMNKRGIVSLPDYPLIAANNESAVFQLLQQELPTTELDDLSRFFFFVSTPDSSHISPLHDQFTRGRVIIVSENPGLHLLWYDEKIFIKPMPQYLSSHAFWERYIDRGDVDFGKPALGFIRTYAHLIRSRLDYTVALEHKLLPGLGSDNFEEVLHFLATFRSVGDENVNARYHYGELRLSRVNIMTRLLSFKYFYYDVRGQYVMYFVRFLTPLVFVFGTLTVALTAMQVVLAVEQLGSAGHWRWFGGLAKWYSVVCMVLVAVALIFFPLLWLGFLMGELMWAMRFVMAKVKRKTMDSKLHV
jgi:hypothetical protein